MSWENTLLPASFRGVQFEVTATNDDIERAVVSHEYPYVDGASTEDMGRSGRRISMTAVFFGDDYEIQLQQLMAALDEAGPGELIHPVFGSIQAQFVRTSIPHQAEQPDQTRLTLEFLESALRAPLFDRVLPLQQVEAVDAAADAALGAASDRFIADIASTGGLPALVRAQLSKDMLGVMDKMRGYCDQLVDARAWLASGAFYLNSPTAFVDDVSSGLVSRLDALMTPIDLRSGYSTAGVVSSATTTGTSTSSVPGYNRGGLETVWNAPKTSLQQPLLVPAERSATAAPVQPFLTTHVDVQIAIVVASCAARLFAMGLDDPVMTPDDIETVAEDARSVLNDAIAQVRSTFPDIVQSRPVTEALKALALGVTSAAEQLIALRPPLLDRTVTTPGNLQLIAHLWYGDYHRADELLRLNPAIRNPNLVRAGTVLRAYSA
jgi:prophage DNA circulation protein